MFFSKHKEKETSQLKREIENQCDKRWAKRYETLTQSFYNHREYLENEIRVLREKITQQSLIIGDLNETIMKISQRKKVKQ